MTKSRLAIPLVLLAVAAVLCVVAARSESAAETAWGAERARLGTDAYDPARSDALYAEVVRTRALLKLGGTSLGALLLGLALVGRAPHAPSDAKRAAWTTRGRAMLATLIDGASVAASGWALSLVVRALDLAGHEALVAFLDRFVPIVVLAAFAALVRADRTPGLAATRTRLAPDPNGWRAAVVTVCAVPAAAVALPLALLALLGGPLVPSLFALHVRLAGLVLAPREPT